MTLRISIVGRLIAGAWLLAGCAAMPPAEPTPPVAPPPAQLHLDRFYAKYLDAAGVPVLGSTAVPDAALSAAASIVREMTAYRPDLRAAIAAQGVRVAIMAESEATTDLPEQRDWKRPTLDDPRLTRCERLHYGERIGAMTDRDYWNQRARGMAGLLTSGAAEDLLGLRSSRYYGEGIFVHEFSHAILNASRDRDPGLYAALERAYAGAIAAGRWKDEYASTSIDEYWAEGTQFWFNSNRLAVFDGTRILSDRNLRDYDPALYGVLASVYGSNHHLAADRWYESPSRIPPGPPPVNTAEQC